MVQNLKCNRPKRFRFFPPLIVLTCSYVLAVFLAAECGWFSRIPPPEISQWAGDRPVSIHGEIASLPQIYPEKICFFLSAGKISANKISGKVWVVYRSVRGDFDRLMTGDLVEVRGRLEKISPAANPGSFNYQAYLNSQGAYFLLKAVSVEKFGSKKVRFFWRRASAAQKSLGRIFEKYLPPREASVLKMMILGDKTQLTGELRKIFVDSGTIHVLIVSGMNVAYLLLIFYWLFRLLRLSRKIFFLALLPLLFFYALICGANPPVVRASLMAGVGFCCYFLEREKNIYLCLATAALAILIIQPKELFNISFQLSFFSVFGLIYLTSFMEKILPFGWKPIRQLAAATFAAQIVCLPLLVFYFNRISLAGFLSNLIIVPWAGLVFAAGLGLVFLSLISSSLAGVFSIIVCQIIHWFNSSVNFFARLPFATVHLASPSLFVLAGIYFFIFLLPKAGEEFLYRKVLYLGIMLWGAVYLAAGVFAAGDRLKIVCFDAGENSALYLKLPTGERMLIDGGGEKFGEEVLTNFLFQEGVSQLDYLVLTHPHYDQYSGFLPVINNFSVRQAFFSPQVAAEEGYLQFSRRLKEKRIPVRQLWSGEQIMAGGIKLKIVNPEYLSGNPDEDSLAILLGYRKFSILLTGGLGVNGINQLNKKLSGLVGLQLGSLADNTDLVWPAGLEFAIMPLEYLSEDGKTDQNKIRPEKIWDTASSGAVTILTDGRDWSIKGYKHD